MEKQLRHRTLIRLFTAPRVLYPIMIGGATFLVAGLTGNVTGWPGIFALAILGIGLATAGVRWSSGREQLQKLAEQDLRARKQVEHLDYLKQLRRRLRRDRDPRTGRIARQLHELHKRMSRVDLLNPANGSSVRAELAGHSKKLYESCVQLLERSLALWNESRRMGTEEARQELLKSRDELVQQVARSTEKLNATIDQIRTSKLKKVVTGDDHLQLRQELDEGLAVAARVEERMAELEKTIQHPDRDFRANTGG